MADTNGPGAGGLSAETLTSSVPKTSNPDFDLPTAPADPRTPGVVWAEFQTARKARPPSGDLDGRVAHYYSLMRLGLELERAGSFAKAVACYTAAKEGAAAEAGDSTLLVADALRALARTHLKRTSWAVAFAFWRLALRRIRTSFSDVRAAVCSLGESPTAVEDLRPLLQEAMAAFNDDRATALAGGAGEFLADAVDASVNLALAEASCGQIDEAKQRLLNEVLGVDGVPAEHKTEAYVLMAALAPPRPQFDFSTLDVPRAAFQAAGQEMEAESLAPIAWYAAVEGGVNSIGFMSVRDTVLGINRYGYDGEPPATAHARRAQLYMLVLRHLIGAGTADTAAGELPDQAIVAARNAFGEQSMLLALAMRYKAATGAGAFDDRLALLREAVGKVEACYGGASLAGVAFQIDLVGLLSSSSAAAHHEEGLALCEALVALKRVVLARDLAPTILRRNMAIPNFVSLDAHRVQLYSAMNRWADMEEAAGAYLAQRREIAEADTSNRLVFGRALRFVGEHRVRAANAKAGSMPDAVATLQEALDVLSEPEVPAADASRDRVFILSVLYDVHYEAGRWNDALTVAEARRDLIIQLRSANDAAMPRAMLAIAQCMCRLGRTAEGSSMVMEAAEKVAAIEGQSQATGRFLKTAGVAMRKLKVHVVALTILFQAAELFETLGEQRPLSIVFTNIALCYEKMKGTRADSLVYHEKSLACKEAIFGENHRRTLRSVEYVADFHEADANHAEVLKWSAREAAIQDAVLSPGEARIHKRVRRQARATAGLGDVEGALALIEDYTGAVPDSAADAVARLSLLAEMYRLRLDNNDGAGAAATEQHMVELAQGDAPEGSRQRPAWAGRMLAHGLLSKACASAEDWERAASHAEEAVAVAEGEQGGADAITAAEDGALMRLLRARALKHMGLLEDAAGMFDSAAGALEHVAELDKSGHDAWMARKTRESDLFDALNSGDDPLLVRALLGVSDCALELGDHPRSIEAARRAVDIGTAQTGKTSASLLFMIARLHEEAGEDAEAFAAYTAAVDAYETENDSGASAARDEAGSGNDGGGASEGDDDENGISVATVRHALEVIIGLTDAAGDWAAKADALQKLAKLETRLSGASSVGAFSAELRGLEALKAQQREDAENADLATDVERRGQDLVMRLLDAESNVNGADRTLIEGLVARLFEILSA